jgi:hypothetical protein
MSDEEAYVIICLDTLSNEGTFLFWKEFSKGYTPSLDDAGLYTKKDAEAINLRGRDVAVTRKRLMELDGVKQYTVVSGSLNQFAELKKNIKEASR